MPPERGTMETQNKQILDYLKSGKSITAIDALNKFKCFRLASRIADLKGLGYNIESYFDYKYDDRGKVVKKWKVYRLGA